MRITPISDLLARHELFSGLDAADVDLVSGCARNEVVGPGTLLAREGEVADRFFVVRQGTVAIELHAAGGPLVVDTAGAGEAVGWAWIFPPYRWTDDVRTLSTTRLVTIETTCLRDKADADPAFGYRIMQRFASVLVAQLDATRLRLLDLYGHG
jgi:CRP/FNR family cyclic AMP-dependent transcriptional regulator